jgi:putative MATE family efflux protein
VSDSPANKHGRDMTSGSIPRHLIAFSMPMLTGNVVQTAYGFVNAFWVGKKLGEAKLAAVTDSFPVIFLLMAVAMGLTMGTGILVSQFAGAREWDRLKKVVQTSTVLLMGIGVFFLIVGRVFAADIMRGMRTPHDVYPMAVSYLRIYIISMPAMFAAFLIASTLRGVGDSKTPLYFQISALIATAVFDPILMFGWLGFPRLGLNGTAVASVCTQWAAALALIIYMARKKHIASPDWRRLSVDWPTLWQLILVGFPSVIQQSLVSLGMIFVVAIINGFGETATAAFGAGMRVDQIAFMPALTIGGAVSMVVGQNIGAGRVHRANEVFRWGIILCGGITLAIAILAMAVPHFLLSMFLNKPAALTTGVHYLRIVAISYVFFAVLFVANGVINGAGYTFVTTIISLVALWAARVPLAVYLSHRMHAVEGVFYAMAISNAVSMLISLACYFSGFWKKPIIRHRPMPAEDVEPLPAIE